MREGMRGRPVGASGVAERTGYALGMRIVSRVIAVFRFKRDLKRCGDFLLEDPPTDTFVREPRRPRPFQPGGAIALELPHYESLD